MEPIYVWHATRDFEWGVPMDYGLFFKKSDAKKACQDDVKVPLIWNDSLRSRSSAPDPGTSDGVFYVISRRVR